MNILVSNDDGIDSPGIYALATSLKSIGNVTVIAPDRQQSAVGHALTLSNPLRVIPFTRNGDFFGYSVNGTPADCVKLAIFELMKEKPDIVVSGINHGSNTAVNILYSGTVSAATEGMLAGIPSMAVSLNSHSYDSDMSIAAEYALELAKQLPAMNLPKDTLLNVNIPSSEKELIKGLKVVPHNTSLWNDTYQKRIDPFNREYYWFSGDYLINRENLESDDVMIDKGYVTVTPIKFDLNNYELFSKMKNLEQIKV
jgi:5'-nucleotidase